MSIVLLSSAFTTAENAYAIAPAITFTSATPSSGVLGIGDSVIVQVTEGGAETGLTAGTVTINGVNVATSISEVSTGVYEFTYQVTEGDPPIADAAMLTLWTPPPLFKMWHFIPPLVCWHSLTRTDHSM